MRNLIVLLILISCGYANAAYVQGAVANAASNAVSAPSITVGSGDVILLATHSSGTASAASLVVSSTGVTCTWSQGTETFEGVSFYSDIAWCQVSSSGAMTVTATWSGDILGDFTDISVSEYSPTSGFVFSGTLLDQILVTTSSGSSVTTCTSGTSAATTNANDLVIGVCFNFNTAQTYGAATGYTLRSASSRNTLGFYDKTVTSTGTQSFSTTISSDIATGWVLALKQTASGGTTPTLGKAIII